MKRRTFNKLAILSTVAVSTYGFIRFHGMSFEGDCETTTDILGPYYRPDSPIRENLVIENEPGDIVELSGLIKNKDCITPFQGTKVELWHCSAAEVYYNDTDEYRYRGTTFCNQEGRYRFITQMPVPYYLGQGQFRPAHFHLLISASKYQSLITQIYFTDDHYLEKDIYAASTKAAERTLTVQDYEGKKYVEFNVNLNDKLLASTSALSKIVGTYIHQDNGEQMVLFEKDNVLWIKNDVFGLMFEYVGNNTFEYPGLPSGISDTLYFELGKKGAVIMTRTMHNNHKNVHVYHKA